MKKKGFTILSVLVGLGMAAGLAGCASNSGEFRLQPDFDAAIAGAVWQTLITTLGEIKVWTKVSMIMDGDRWLIMKILYRSERGHT